MGRWYRLKDGRRGRLSSYAIGSRMGRLVLMCRLLMEDTDEVEFHDARDCRQE